MSEDDRIAGPNNPSKVTLHRSAKVHLGAATLLLLTPFAVALAFGASCGVAVAYGAVAFYVAKNEPSLEWLLYIAFAIFWLPPLVTFIAMLRAIIRAQFRPTEKDKNDQAA